MLDLREGPTETFPDEHAGPFPLPCPVIGGFVVFVENPLTDPRNPQNWSDVLVFSNPGIPPSPTQPVNYATLVSESPDASGVEVGITDADLAPLGVTILNVLTSITVFIPESETSDLNPYIPVPGIQDVYNVFSDPAERPTPAKPGTWGMIKRLYR